MEIKYYDTIDLAIDGMRRSLCSADSILDVGCGIMPERYLYCSKHICVEPCMEYRKYLKKEYPNNVVVNATLDQLPSFFDDGSVDTVFLLEVIEHIDREPGFHALERALKIPRKQFVLSTPLGFMPQEPESDGTDKWGMSGGEWQRHRSGWLPGDFPVREGGQWSYHICKTATQVALGDGEVQVYGAQFAVWTADGINTGSFDTVERLLVEPVFLEKNVPPTTLSHFLPQTMLSNTDVQRAAYSLSAIVEHGILPLAYNCLTQVHLLLSSGTPKADLEDYFYKRVYPAARRHFHVDTIWDQMLALLRRATRKLCRKAK